MNSKIKLYIKAFFIFGVTFGLMLLTIDLVQGDETNIRELVFKGTVFGVFMSLLLVSIHLYNIRDAEGGLESNGLLLGSRRLTLQSADSLENIYQKLVDNRTISSIDINSKENQIYITTNSSWLSWGEKIEIRLNPISDHLNDIYISSRSWVRTAILDNGKNLKNINLIKGLIKQDQETS